jgi:hypothetical protein
MEVSGQLQQPAFSSPAKKKSLVLIKQKAGWAPDTVSMVLDKQKKKVLCPTDSHPEQSSRYKDYTQQGPWNSFKHRCLWIN